MKDNNVIYNSIQYKLSATEDNLKLYSEALKGSHVSPNVTFTEQF